jgi:hypothetical protein
VRAIHSKNLKRLALHSANPARDVVGVSIGERPNRVFKFGQARLILGELAEVAQSNPAFVLTLVGANERRNQVSDDGHGQQRYGDAVQQQPNLCKPLAARDVAYLLFVVYFFPVSSH